jgi:hypothetical protein
MPCTRLEVVALYDHLLHLKLAKRHYDVQKGPPRFARRGHHKSAGNHFKRAIIIIMPNFHTIYHMAAKLPPSLASLKKYCSAF